MQKMLLNHGVRSKEHIKSTGDLTRDFGEWGEVGRAAVLKNTKIE